MLRAALIGFAASGKTTLFQLMTSARETARASHGKGETTVGISKVPEALVDVAPYKNADALVHVLRAFRDPAVAHPSGAIDPARDAQAMEDELILADLGVAERRLERLEKDLKKGKSPELEKERDLIKRCQTALEAGTPLRALELSPDDVKRLRGFQFL